MSATANIYAALSDEGIMELCPTPRIAPPPWIEMPVGGEPFDRRASIATPAIAPNVFVTVLSFRVPTGMDGVILGYANLIQGGIFNSGDDSISWAIRVDGRFLRTFGNITHTSGDTQNNRSIHGGIIVKSNSLLEMVIENITFAVGGTRTTCGLNGYYWPIEYLG